MSTYPPIDENDWEPSRLEEQQLERIEELTAMLNDAHDMLHRIVCVFVMVPVNDGAHKQATDLMRRIRYGLGVKN